MDDAVFLLLSLLVLSLIVGGIAAIVVASSAESNDVESRCALPKNPYTSMQDAGSFLIRGVRAFALHFLDGNSHDGRQFITALDNLDKKISGKFKISYPSSVRVFVVDEGACRVLKIPEIDRLTIDDIRGWFESEKMYRDTGVYEIDMQVYIDDRYQLRGVDKRTIPKGVPPKEEIENAGAIAKHLGEQRWLVRDLKTNEKKFVSMTFHREDIQDFVTLGKTIADGPFVDEIMKFVNENFKYIKK